MQTLEQGKAGRMTNIQAIDLLKGLEQSLDDYCELNDEGKTAFRMAITALELFGNSEQLPSAQPEIIRCKDCECGEQDEVGRWFCRSLGCQIGNEDGSGYCADAERRTDE